MNKLMYQFNKIGFPLDVNLDECLNMQPDLGDNTCENYRFSDCQIDDQLLIAESGGLYSASDCQVNTKVTIFSIILIVDCRI